MKTIFLKQFAVLTVFTVVLILSGCKEDENLVPASSNNVSSLNIKSATFVFTSLDDEKTVLAYGFCDEDGCCTTPAEKVDEILLEANQKYICTIKINGDENASKNLSFSYLRAGSVDLNITSVSGNSTNGIYTEWETGNVSNGFIRLSIDLRPDNPELKSAPIPVPENRNYTIMIPVEIKESLVPPVS